jgi:hypothetical protein
MTWATRQATMPEEFKADRGDDGKFVEKGMGTLGGVVSNADGSTTKWKKGFPGTKMPASSSGC